MYDQNIKMPAEELAGRKPAGKSPQRMFQDPAGGPIQRPRIPDATWRPALERCQDEGIPMGHVLTELLEAWLAGEIKV